MDREITRVLDDLIPLIKDPETLHRTVEEIVDNVSQLADFSARIHLSYYFPGGGDGSKPAD